MHKKTVKYDGSKFLIRIFYVSELPQICVCVLLKVSRSVHVCGVLAGFQL